MISDYTLLLRKLKKIKLLITDVDGVLTDGGLYYTDEGLVMKKFNVKDGMAVRLLREAGIKSGMISTDTTKLMQLRAERLNMDFSFIGIWDKAAKMLEICEELNLFPENAAFIGDDINDLEVMQIAGVTACPADAVKEIKKSSDYICAKKGGEGAFREFAELILKARSSDQ